MRIRPIILSSIAGAIVTVVLLSAGCGISADTGASASAGSSAPAPPAGPSTATSSKVGGGFLSKEEVCKKIETTSFGPFMQSLVDAAPATTPGVKPTYDPKLIAVMQTNAKTAANGLKAVAEKSSDSALASVLRRLADAVAAYGDVTDISAAEAQGSALTAAVNELRPFCLSSK